MAEMRKKGKRNDELQQSQGKLGKFHTAKCFLRVQFAFDVSFPSPFAQTARQVESKLRLRL